MRLIVSGGGTGGHIYPALAIAQAVKSKFPESKILYVGTQQGLESQIVPQAGFAFQTVEIKGINRSSRLRWVGSVAAVPGALRQAYQIIRKFQPDTIVGTGGYVSFPVVLAGTFLGCRTYIHEQNAFPGLTNRLLAKRVKSTMLTFPEAKQWLKGKRMIETGLPVREAFLHTDRVTARKELNLAADCFTLLVFGGSLGASSINTAVRQLLKKYLSDSVQLIWITGKDNYEKIKADLTEKEASRVRLYPYFYAMEQAMAAADLAICRSGASTLSELSVVGLPAILIPYPYATADHQTYNARALEKRGAAEMIANAELDANRLYHVIESIRQDEGRMKKMQANMVSSAHYDAIECILNEISR